MFEEIKRRQITKLLLNPKINPSYIHTVEQSVANKNHLWGYESFTKRGSPP